MPRPPEKGRAVRPLTPFRKFFRLFARLLGDPPRLSSWALLVFGSILGWWIYVPLHELLHAFGCLLGGGEVSRLEISPLYGGGMLARILPFVKAGGQYAGRLSGFDTGGSDRVYALTIAFPYLLTLPSLAVMEHAARRSGRLLFGLALPFFLAPLIGLSGDFYELGSLGLFQLWPGPEGIHRGLVSDDMFRLLREVEASGSPLTWNTATAAFAAVSLGLGALAAWSVLLATAFLERLCGRGGPGPPAGREQAVSRPAGPFRSGR